jgi:D-alanyl-D-alanine carboxypeptidase
MNRTAKALGMTRTTFKNMHGLTSNGHMSTARDMTTLGRHVLYDYPQYYNLFSRRSTHAGIRQVANTNRRLLGAYKGADGIKTGYMPAWRNCLTWGFSARPTALHCASPQNLTMQIRRADRERRSAR